jgi:hypothetical protein
MTSQATDFASDSGSESRADTQPESSSDTRTDSAPPLCAGTWSFAPSAGYFTGMKEGQEPAGIAVGDFNHDGAIDIASVNFDNSVG